MLLARFHSQSLLWDSVSGTRPHDQAEFPPRKMKDQNDSAVSSPTTESPKRMTGPLGNVTLFSPSKLKPESIDLDFSTSKTLATLVADEESDKQFDKQLPRRNDSKIEGSFSALIESKYLVVSNTARHKSGRFRVSEHIWRMTIVHNKSSKYGGIDFENAFVLQNRSTRWEVSKKFRKLLSKIGISMLLMQGNDFRSLGSRGGDLSMTLNLYLWASVLLYMKEMRPGHNEQQEKPLLISVSSPPIIFGAI
jgi:hypothetical protein